MIPQPVPQNPPKTDGDHVQQSVAINQNLAYLQSLVPAATQATVSLTGFATAPSGAATFALSNGIVSMVTPNLLGTSNATTLTLTGIPTAYQPAANRLVPCIVQNSGAATPARASITGGTITFAVATAFNAYSSTGFTASGTKGLDAGNTISWMT